VQDYRQLVRALSLSAADLVAETSEPRRLDYATGAELVGDHALDGPVEDARQTA